MYEEEIKKKESVLISNELVLNNLLRSLTMLENTKERIVRQNYYSPNQYPEIVLEIEEAMKSIRSWIETYRVFSAAPMFSILLGLCIEELGGLLKQLILTCKPLPGKKEQKKTSRINDHKKLCTSIDAMLEHLSKYLAQLKSVDTLMSIKIEEALMKGFKNHFVETHQKKIRYRVSIRGIKSYIFPFASKDGYHELINDKKRLKSEVIEHLSKYPHATGHKDSCCAARYILAGYRPNSRKPIMKGGNQEEIPIRMVKCVNCNEKFSLLPSFLPREKHFAIDIIGHVFESILLFGQSLQGALQAFNLTGKAIKSKQTILNWLMWIGNFHPATILSRAGVKGSGYFHEDEGFEKEANIRTYTVIMVDPENLLVWHSDYVDHVDEENLCSSFKKFLERIDFKVLGATKDKWKASTNALKKVFHNIWLGFCHRHWLKKFWDELSEYQDKSKCSANEIRRLYKKVKELLKFSCSSKALKAKVNALAAEEEAFKHPLLQNRLEELKINASHYTCYRKRKGITSTTYAVDNYLKTVKRKLRQVESFRNQECTKVLFKAMANVRNFVPFLSGAKNANKSPFMLAQGKTFDLPWIQVMNYHNAFLFSDNAF